MPFDVLTFGRSLVLVASTPTTASVRPQLESASLSPRSVAQETDVDVAIQRALDAADANSTIYLASARSADFEHRSAVACERGKVVPIGLAGQAFDDVARLEAAGVWFVARDTVELTHLLVAPTCADSLAVVLLAYNEAATIAAAITDIRRFCKLHLARYEIIVVDDGSSDDTGAIAAEISAGDVRVLRHQKNRGMGASMRTGYLAATADYIVALPADRQIRAQQLSALLPHLSPEGCVHGFYRIPHSGPARAVMSAAFRFVVQRVGNLKVEFAGAYIFHRRWLQPVDLERLRCESFVFSFELLEQLRRNGCRFTAVEMRAFSRQVGQSRVARPGRIARVFGEVMRSRLARAIHR